MSRPRNGRPRALSDELCRLVAELRIRDGLSWEFIARETGQSESTLRRAVRRARALAAEAPPSVALEAPPPPSVALEAPPEGAPAPPDVAPASADAAPADVAPVPALGLRGRVTRLQAALEEARAGVSPESPIAARLLSDLVDARLLLARLDRATPSALAFTRDELDEASRSMIEKFNAAIAGVKLECAHCSRELVAEPLEFESIWRPPHDSGTHDPGDLVAEVSAEVDDLAAMLAVIGDPNTGARYMRQAGRLLNLIGRLEANADRDLVVIDPVEDATRAEECDRMMAAYASRPLLCASCSRALSAAWGGMQLPASEVAP
jgi:hypothetical protein